MQSWMVLDCQVSGGATAMHACSPNEATLGSASLVYSCVLARLYVSIRLSVCPSV